MILLKIDEIYVDADLFERALWLKIPDLCSKIFSGIHKARKYDIILLRNISGMKKNCQNRKHDQKKHIDDRKYANILFPVSAFHAAVLLE